MKLRSKILAYTLPLILIPFLLMAIAVYYFVIQANHIQVQEEERRNINEAILSIQGELDSVRKDVDLLSKVRSVINYLDSDFDKADLSVRETTGSEESARNVLELFFKRNPYYLRLSVVDREGKERIKFSRGKDEKTLNEVSKEPYFRRTLILGNLQTPVRKISPDKFATVFTKSVLKEKFLGMIVLYVNTDIFQRSIRSLQKRNLSTFLFDDRGVLFASVFKSRDEEEIVKALKLNTKASSQFSSQFFYPSKRSIARGKQKFKMSFIPSVSFPRRHRFEVQDGENWFLGVLEPDVATFVPIAFQAVFFSILLIAIMAVLWVASRVSKRITIPLENVSLATRGIGRGDSKLELNVKTGDEVEDLAAAITKMDRDLKHYQETLVQSAKLATMGEMTSAIAHEIQNRISGVSLWLQHLDSEVDSDDPRKEYLDEMKLGLNGFMRMLRGLKEYYKKPVLDKKAVNLNLLIEEAFAFVEDAAEQKSIGLKTAFSSDIPIVSGDEDKLKSVILNLILNAIEATDDGGKVSVETTHESENDEVCVTIRDNGKGIEERKLSQIFYPFYTTKSDGSGLGLAISSNIIAAHKGRIEVESEIGKGTIFKIFLPYSD